MLSAVSKIAKIARITRKNIHKKFRTFTWINSVQYHSVRSVPANDEIYLSRAQVDEIAAKLDAIYYDARVSLGNSERKYIYRVLRIQGACEFFGRIIPLIFRSRHAHNIGIGSLAASKIIDNMEIGHNVMHGQYDWMGEKPLLSKNFEWDMVCPAEQWRHSHNVIHHKNTNIRGIDKDLGYNTLRVNRNKRWKPYYLGNTIYACAMMLFFEWGVMIHDCTISDFYTGRRPWKEILPFARQWGKKSGKQIFKDYFFFPLLSGRKAHYVRYGNFIANIIRNMWAHAIIFCGHFPIQAQTFNPDDIGEESKGEWYIRQILGSSNIYGNSLFHFFSGNLSFQIEHHLFPDIPSCRYKEIAPQVRAICLEYGLPYNNGRFTQQISSVWLRLAKLSLPDRFSTPEKEIRLIIEPKNTLSSAA